MLKIKLKKKEKKEKRKKFVGKGLKIVDEEDPFGSNSAKHVSEESDVEDVEDLPQIANVVDERPVEVQVLESFNKGKWKRLEDDTDNFQTMVNGTSPTKRSPLPQTSHDSDDQSPPRVRRRERDSLDPSPLRHRSKHDSDDPSPPRRKDKRDSPDLSSSHVRRRHDSSDLSPPRGTRKVSPRERGTRTRQGSRDRSPTFQKSRSRKDASDQSPTRSRRQNSRDQSPPRRRRDSVDTSPPRRRDRRNSPDFSSHRRKRRHSSPDLSPPRGGKDSPPRQGERRRRDSWDQSPRQKSRFRRDSSDQSPPRSKRQNSCDQSPPRRRRDSFDASPPRRNIRNSPMRSPPRQKRRADSTDASPPRRDRSRRQSNDASPPRKFNNSRNSDRRRERERNVAMPEVIDTKDEEKSKTTLDGKKAGLQKAAALRDEMHEFRKREKEMYEQLPDEVSGRNARAIVRDRRTEEDMAKEAEKAKKEEERKKQYDKWGKGLKQVAEHEENVRSALHEMSKPLARYKNDGDLDDHLKNIDREGDPMLEYLTAKRKKAKGEPEKPKYTGPPPPPNRFKISPGFRWDGVDRSNGYEKEWFNRINARKAFEEEAYKWSVEDL